MANSRKVRRKRPRREALVFAHLEGVSRKLFEQHPDVVRKFIGRNSGIYALFRKKSLYYVGLATALRGRLKAHIKNRHGESWDRFSIYLTINDQHLREIEALLLRIASPPGAKQHGKLAQSKDMRRRIARAIRAEQESEVMSLFGRSSHAPEIIDGTDTDLTRLLPQGGRLRGSNKGKIYKALARPNGKIRFNGKYYKSLSVAASTALKRPTNGWWFWQVERGRGNWVRLNKIRRAGTPVFRR
jgi:hypothetical protein